jgi:hypothetical protein
MNSSTRLRCCGFYHHTGKLVRHGSDGNPIIWMNIAQSGITLWGKDAKLIAPHVSGQCLNDALLLELSYLNQTLISNAGDRSDRAFIYKCLRGPHRLTHPVLGLSQGTGFQRPGVRLGYGNRAAGVAGGYSSR